MKRIKKYQFMQLKQYVHYPFHFISYYVVWLLTIYLAARHHTVLAPLFAFFITAIQYSWQYFVAKKTDQLFKLSCFIVFAGFINDSCLTYFHLFRFLSNPFSYPFSPPWMLALWFNFSVTLYAIGQTFLHNLFGLTLFCLLGFPLAYLVGVNLGAAILLKGAWSLITVSISGTSIVLIARVLLMPGAKHGPRAFKK